MKKSSIKINDTVFKVVWRDDMFKVKQVRFTEDLRPYYDAGYVFKTFSTATWLIVDLVWGDMDKQEVDKIRAEMIRLEKYKKSSLPSKTNREEVMNKKKEEKKYKITIIVEVE